ncbi:borealin [Microplitis mediator]|uniref:borealin n=1 Tax=Microplitis mediator TaxID=375433 RepID=UPI002552836B|nr:borealin [Microplitis mediator]
MPRTKQVRKRSSSHTVTDESDLLIKDCEKKVLMGARNSDATYNTIIDGMKNHIDTALFRIPPEIRKMTLGDLLDLDEDSNENIDPNEESFNNDQTRNIFIPQSSIKSTKILKRQTAASTDDGYATEAGTKKKSLNDASKLKSKAKVTHSSRATRSSSKDEARKLPRSPSASSNRSTSKTRIAKKMFTPTTSKLPTKCHVITPKIEPNTPMNILRRPREGEVALSMQGSPLLVSAVSGDRMASINVPLNNGNVMSLLPKDGKLRLSNLPGLDEESTKQLKILKEHLEKVIGNK